MNSIQEVRDDASFLDIYNRYCLSSTQPYPLIIPFIFCLKNDRYATTEFRLTVRF